MTHAILKALLAFALLVSLALVPASAAPSPAAHAGTPLGLEAGSGRILSISSPVANIFVADPKVAEVRPASATSLFVFGLNPGRTTIAVTDTEGTVLVQYDLTVQPSSFSAREAQSALDHLVPGHHVKVKSQGKGLMLTGSVKSPADSAQAMAIARGYVPEGANVDNEVVVESPIQVTLNVRVAQMSRQVVRNLGINWQAIATIGSIAQLPALALNVNGSTLTCVAGVAGGSAAACPGAGFNGVIDALAKDNLAHVLAEPNLTVISGQSASFQVGGEYPVPTSQGNGAVGVTFKSFGVLLSFLPTVMTDGRINLHVKPEVSELSSLNSATITTGTSTQIIPSLTVRRAETTVELGTGESFAIAGLLQQGTNDNGSGLPGLGDIPIAGALFRDNQFARTETELVIVVTPYIVRPVARPSALRLPTDGYAPPTDLERLLLMRQVSRDKAPVPVSIPGNAGFIVQ